MKGLSIPRQLATMLSTLVGTHESAIMRAIEISIQGYLPDRKIVELDSDFGNNPRREIASSLEIQRYKQAVSRRFLDSMRFNNAREKFERSARILVQ